MDISERVDIAGSAADVTDDAEGLRGANLGSIKRK